jgi:hypothetical protein
LRGTSKIQQAVMVVTFCTSILEVLGLNLGWTLALLTQISRDENIQNINITLFLHIPRNIGKIKFAQLLP